MDIIPAVDVKDGKCVRLYQGDYDKETVFSTDPVSVAVGWQEMGAERIHVVDLDGASSGSQLNVLMRGKRLPVLGVSMEHTTVDLTGIDKPPVHIGAKVVNN